MQISCVEPQGSEWRCGRRRLSGCKCVFLSFQAISRLCEDKFKDLSRAAMRRSLSADNLIGVRHSNAVLS